MSDRGNDSNIRRILSVAVFIFFVTVLHYTTPTSKGVYHEVYNRLYYIPIILGAFFFGFRGGITVSIVISLLFVPHILVDWGGLIAGNINMVTEVFLYNVVGAVTGLLVSSERKSREELEEKTNLLLQREDDLRQSERLSLLGEMSAMMAHEIRNPLGSIKGAAEILSDKFEGGEEGYRYAEILTREVDRLNDVVDNFIRVGSIRKEPPVPVDVNELLDDLLFFFGRVATRKGIEIDVRHEPELPRIHGSPNQLRQVFMNVILNAFYAMGGGGRLTITTVGSGNGIEITFRDTGVGIPEETMARLFEPFFTTRDSGTGLGLTITRRIIEAHGGMIEIDSKVGKGTSVRLTLPVKREES